MRNKFLILVLIMTIFVIPSSVDAGRGCCSHHGGQNYCDTSTGKWVCNDGTYSPTCTCSSSNISNNNDSISSNDNNSSNDSNYEETKAKNTENLENNNTNNINDNSEMIALYIFLGLMVLGAIGQITSKK